MIMQVQDQGGNHFDVDLENFTATSEEGNTLQIRRGSGNPVDWESRRIDLVQGKIKLNRTSAVRLRAAFELQKPMLGANLDTWDRIDVRIHERLVKNLSVNEDPTHLRPDQWGQVVCISGDEATLQIEDAKGNPDVMPIDKGLATKLFNLCSHMQTTDAEEKKAAPAGPSL